MIGIYCFRFDNGKCYVGQSKEIERRIRDHSLGRSDCSLICKAVAKYGNGAFVVEILEICEEENLHAREAHWISALDCVAPNGYNLTTGGDGGRRLSEQTKQKLSKAHTGKRVSDETRRKLSEINKGNKHSPETCRKMSESRTGEGNHFYGRKHSPESIEKMRKAQKKSLETRKKIGDAHRGRKLTPEHRRKISEGNKGREVSEYQRQRTRESNKDRSIYRRRLKNPNQGRLFE